MPGDGKIPILLDTDIGSDIDDAVCLAYLLAQSRCELVGITTVRGEAVKRAMLADAVCRAAGRKDVPIFAGADEPLIGPRDVHGCKQAAILDRFPHRKDFVPNEAVPFLRETIRKRPGELTLLTIGPLTNIGILFALDREIPRLLKRIVMMCGVFSSRTAGAGPVEWNAICDPVAAAIVYNTRGVENLSVGLEVTCRCRMPADECRRRFRGGALDVVAAAAEVWYAVNPEIIFHDPLAAVCIFRPEVCEYRRGLVEVELASEKVKGMTHFDANAPEKPHTVAFKVSPEKFFEEYFGTVTGAAAR
ncbi:MAG: nucleoside hydrolase [Planctomycetota bacterium]|nr:nucleoside hydrolase [Planctomycetota bacterium]